MQAMSIVLTEEINTKSKMNKLVLISRTVLDSLSSCGNSVENDCIDIERKNHSLLNSV